MSDPREPVDGVDTPPADDDPNLGDIDDLDPGLDDEPEPEIEPDEPEAEEVQPRRQTRRERQTENWRTKAQQLEVELAELRGRVSQPQSYQPPVDPMAAQRAEQEELQRIAMLPPEEQMGALLSKVRREFNQGLNNVALQSAERADVAAFETLKRQIPAAQRLAGKVEETVRQLRAQGTNNINREAIFKFHLGEEALARAAAGNTRERRQGAANVRRQTTRPANGRGDLARSAGNGRGADADEALLRGTTVGEI